MVLQVNKEFVDKTADFRVVGTAMTGKEALEGLERETPHLVILDIYLPDISGVQILQEIRRRELPLDVILVTAARDAEIIQNVFRYGALDYIIKPFKMERLQAALQAYKTLHQRLLGRYPLEQEDLDRLKSPNRQDLPPDPPKGLHDVTLRQVFLYVLKSGTSLSSEEVADGVGLARVTARRYLDYLEKVGKLELEVQYGSVGRPVNKYKIP